MLRLALRGRPRVSAGGALAVALALLAACETSPPELYELQWLLLDFDDLELDQRYESLSLFVRAGDADGADDLDELYVIFDAGELFWRLTAATWTRTEHEGATWIGSTTISMPGREPFPPGEYRLLLLDRGGQRDAAHFAIPAQRRPTAAPEVAVRGPRFEVHGAAPYQLWVAGVDGLVTTLDASGTVDLEEHFDFRTGARYQVYVFGQAEGADKGFLSGPYHWQAP